MGSIIPVLHQQYPFKLSIIVTIPMTEIKIKICVNYTMILHFGCKITALCNLFQYCQLVRFNTVN